MEKKPTDTNKSKEDVVKDILSAVIAVGSEKKSTSGTAKKMTATKASSSGTKKSTTQTTSNTKTTASKSSTSSAKKTTSKTSASGTTKSTTSNANKTAPKDVTVATVASSILKTANTGTTKDNSKGSYSDVITKAKNSADVVNALGKGKSKKTKTLLSVLSVIVMIVLIVSGSLYYFDIPPFNFDFSNSFGKYYSGSITYSEGDLRVHFIDVGQGDCIFIEFPDNKNMVIDGGKNNSTTEKAIVDYISNIIGQNAKIDYLMLTHTDSDHSGGIDAVFDNFEIKRVYMPFTPSGVDNDPVLKKVNELGKGTLFNNNSYVTTAVYKKFVEKAVTEKSEIFFSFDSTNNYDEKLYNDSKSCDIIGDAYSVKFYSPSLEFYLKNMSDAANKNNVSPMLVLEFNGKKLLLTGDADDDAEKHFLANTPTDTRDVDFLKVAHHGGQQSTSQIFLQTITPTYSVISVGSNSYGHPTSAVLNRLSAIKSNVLRTDLKGDIVLTISGNKFAFKCYKTSENFGDNGEYDASKIWQRLYRGVI